MAKLISGHFPYLWIHTVLRIPKITKVEKMGWHRNPYEYKGGKGDLIIIIVLVIVIIIIVTIVIEIIAIIIIIRTDLIIFECSQA